MERDLEPLRKDSHFAGLVPDALREADPAVQQLVVLLYRELGPVELRREQSYEWMRTIQLAALGHAQAQFELASLGSENRYEP